MENTERETRLLEIAEAIYNEISGADNKQEIYDWLANGDRPETYTLADVPAFVEEWREYNGLDF